MKTLLIALFSALFLLPSVSLGAPQRTISVSGTAVTRIVPDTIVWSVTVTSTDPQLSKAKKKSDERLKYILGVAKRLGAPEHCLQTGYLNVNKEYERKTNGRQGPFKHFTITRTATIKSTDTSRFDDYLTALVKNPDMRVSYTLETSELETVRWETRIKAMEVVKKKAMAMTKVVGAQIGKPITITENAHGRTPNNISNAYSFADQGGLDDLNGGTFAAGSIPVSVTVSVVFQLE